MSRPSYENFVAERESILAEEAKRYLGSDLELSPKEKVVNEILKREKNLELVKGFADPGSFAPAKHFFDALDDVKASKVFKILRKMPKFGVLHCHDTALLSTDKIVAFTYRANLWICGDLFTSVPRFLFSREKPADGSWVKVADEREKFGATRYDAAMRSLFTLYAPDAVQKYRDINAMWSKFMELFAALDPIVGYVEIWKDYYYETLKEFYEDGVQYLEFRGLLPELYDLDGNKYEALDIAGMYVEVLEKFKAENPGFVGSKFIYAPLRFADNAVFERYLQTYRALKAKFPDFIAGFDLVGQEDTAFPLKGFADHWLKDGHGIPCIFHAGETNWNGMDTDENLVDAILLGTKRIGHGFAAVKHPRVLEELKKRDICVEVNPVSNQVLKLVDDYRNHPAAILFSDNYPVVVSSDDPSFWEATPLSHDFYMAFVGIASKHADLKFLKKLAMNSIKYSSLSDTEQKEGTKKWQEAWDKFLDDVIEADKKGL
ncbi:adenosine deaminase AGSA-like [Culicoides brevitarsis]|uniref:adenosine deaminase AGSA-like n=1 Tax=Culicoides brevitarsis TaxID=469753 RepID=UPI00307C1A05